VFPSARFTVVKAFWRWPFSDLYFLGSLNWTKEDDVSYLPLLEKKVYTPKKQKDETIERERKRISKVKI
jgi:hypothetical protein